MLGEIYPYLTARDRTGHEFRLFIESAMNNSFLSSDEIAQITLWWLDRVYPPAPLPDIK